MVDCFLVKGTKGLTESSSWFIGIKEIVAFKLTFKGFDWVLLVKGNWSVFEYCDEVFCTGIAVAVWVAFWMDDKVEVFSLIALWKKVVELEVVGRRGYGFIVVCIASGGGFCSNFFVSL